MISISTQLIWIWRVRAVYALNFTVLTLKRHTSPAEKKSKVNSYNTATGFYFQRNILNLLIKGKEGGVNY